MSNTLLPLQRSSFDAVNDLDFIPMDVFEAKFWKLRQSELEGYNLLYSPLKPRQGDLTGERGRTTGAYPIAGCTSQLIWPVTIA